MSSTAHADKFVVRLPEGMRDAVAERAAEAFISMNSFVVQSVAEKLDREQRARIAIEALEYTASHVGGVECFRGEIDTIGGITILEAPEAARALPDDQSESDNAFYMEGLFRRACAAFGLSDEESSWFEIVDMIESKVCGTNFDPVGIDSEGGGHD